MKINKLSLIVFTIFVILLLIISAKKKSNNLLHKIYKNRENKVISCIIHKDLYLEIEEEFSVYFNDLVNEGYNIKIHKVDGSYYGSDIRKLLINDYKNMNISGAFLIGNIPVVMYEEGLDSFPYPIDYYYMDLNGKWHDKDKDGWFDGHDDPDHSPEIYIGRLKADNIGGSEVELIKEYFKRNHAYRTGKFYLPEKAINFLAPGFKTCDQRMEVPYGMDRFEEYNELSGEEFLQKLGNNKAELACLLTHSYPEGHTFGEPRPGINSIDISKVNKNYHFYVFHACAVGNYTRVNNIANTYLFRKSQGLYAFAVTKSAGCYYMDNYFVGDFLDMDHTSGNALFSFHTLFAPDNFDKSDEGEWIILGDPTLKLSKYYKDNYNDDNVNPGWYKFNNDYTYSRKKQKDWGQYYNIIYGNLDTKRSSWGHYKDRSFGDYKEDLHSTLKAEDFCLFTFYGKEINCYAEIGEDHGQMEVYVDYAYQTTVNVRGKREAKNLVFSHKWEKNGKHQIILVNKVNNQWGNIDYFAVRVGE